MNAIILILLTLTLSSATTALAANPVILAAHANGELIWDNAFTNGEASIECCTNLSGGNGCQYSVRI